jgi:nucleotide-binding universal stress UspA family protein
MSTRYYLVPFDFSSVGLAAIKHAAILAKPAKAELLILNIVDAKNKIQPTLAKLEQYLPGIEKDALGVKMTPIVTMGTIFEDIGRIAEKYSCGKIIMGTHGAKGMQKLFGSHALKVILSTSTPFVIVQDSTPSERIDNIIVPIDLTKESLQIIHFAADIAVHFNSTVHVVGETQRDEILSRQMKNRIMLVEKKFEELNVKAELKIFESSGSYSSKILKYADQINAELIAVAYHSESLIPALDGFHQGLLTNAQKIPVLIIQSKEVSSSYF